ncbi:MAG: NADP-dependent oxidoreductase [bacterium]
MPVTARTLVLVARPVGKPQQSDFRLEMATLPDPASGEVLLQTLYLSLDPYMRGRMSDAPSYAAPTTIGEPPPSEVVARVLQSGDPGFLPGDIVVVHDFWRDHAIRKATALRKLNPDLAPIQTALGVMGMPGLTAYGGLKHIGKVKPGETVVVGAASGAVGGLVGQIARLSGARAVGVAGGAEKCAYVKGELGFDACIDRNDPDMAAQLKAACPDGVDVYFELTGGAIFNAALPLLNPFGRVPVCGTIAGYNATDLPPGPDRSPLLMRSILTRSLTFRGFIVSEFAADADEFHRKMAHWLASGAVKYREDVTDGLDNMVATFIGMLEGKNFGKTLIKLSD